MGPSFYLQDKVLSDTEAELQFVKDHKDDDEALLEGITMDLSKFSAQSKNQDIINLN